MPTAELETGHRELSRQADEQLDRNVFAESSLYAEVQRRTTISLQRLKAAKSGNVHQLGKRAEISKANSDSLRSVEKRNNVVQRLARIAFYNSRYTNLNRQDTIKTTYNNQPASLQIDPHSVTLSAKSERSVLEPTKASLATVGETVTIYRMANSELGTVGVTKVDNATQEVVSQQIFHNPEMSVTLGNLVIEKIGGAVESELAAQQSRIQAQLDVLHQA